MKQQLSEDYMGFKPWYCHGDILPWTHDSSPDGHETYVGTITAAAAATDFDDDTQNDAAIEALSATKKVLIKIPQGWVGIAFRFRSNGTEDDAIVTEMFASFGVDHYMRFATLTMAEGKQEHTTGAVGTAIRFLDTLVASNASWFTLGYAGTTTNRIGTYAINTHGADRFCIMASTLTLTGGTTMYVDFKQL
jgi:hypothetical protein